MGSFVDFFEENSWRFSGGGLWVSGKEPGALVTSEWEKRPVRVLILRLSTYEDTALSFTHNLLYALAEKAGLFPDLAFLPPSQDGEILTQAGIPWIFGTKTKRPWQDFDLIAVSNSLIQELGNLLILEKFSSIPLSITERSSKDLPLILLGGANAPSSSILTTPEPPVDGIFLGEDETQIQDIFKTFKEGKIAGLDRSGLLHSLETLTGFYRPDQPGSVVKTHKKGTWDPLIYGSLIPNFADGNSGKAVLPLSDGCAGFCSFCHESFVRKPYGENPCEDVISLAREIKNRTGAYRLDLFSFNFNMHQDFYKILDTLTDIYPHIGLKSQRLDSIAQDPVLIPVQKLLGKQFFTVGLEGISQDIRSFLNKNLSEAQVRSSLGVLAQSGVRELKVFLIATGREQESDFHAFEELLDYIKVQPTPSGHPLKATFSVTPLVRFPHTPLEFDPFPGVKFLDRVIRRIVSQAERKGFQGRQAASAQEAAVCDLLLRARDPEIYPRWKDLILEKNFVYYNEIPVWFYAALQSILETIPTRIQDPPWAAVDTGLNRDFLKRQYDLNLQGLQTPFPQRKTPVPARDYARVLGDKLKKLKSLESSVCFHVTWTDSGAGIGRGFVWARVMGIIGSLIPEVTQSYRGWGRGAWEKDPDAPVWVGGDDLVHALFLPQAREGLEKLFKEKNLLNQVNERGKDLFTLHGLWTEQLPQWHLEFSSPYALDSGSFLTGHGLKHTYTKVAEGKYNYLFTQDALKKKVVMGLSGEKKGNLWIYHLDPGPKFDVNEFLTKGFLIPEKGAWRRIQTSAKLINHGASLG